MVVNNTYVYTYLVTNFKDLISLFLFLFSKNYYLDSEKIIQPHLRYILDW